MSSQPQAAISKILFLRFLFLLTLANLISLSACVPVGQHRGMSGSTYVSTSRPAFSLKAADLPFLVAADGNVSLWESGMAETGIRAWVNIWGVDTGPFVIAAHAELPECWYWDGNMSRPFSINEGKEVIGNWEWQAFTYIDDNQRSPFSLLAQSSSTKSGKRNVVEETGWLVRAFVSRHNFDRDKIILEYREKLPAEIQSLAYIPYGQTEYVKAFEERARKAFVISVVPQLEHQIVRAGMSDKVQWRYLDGRFLGTASRQSIENMR